MAYERKEQEDGERKILLGLIGERIVAHYLRNMGHVVEESLNVFDMEKDMMVCVLKQIPQQCPMDLM